MPPRAYDSTKKTFYLDQSTVSDAFRATAGPGVTGDPGYAPLRPWIERVAHEANLWFSTAHILETARLNHAMTAEGLAAWVDSLPTVWVRSLLDVDPEEDDYWTKVAAGLTPSTKVVAFTSDIASAFGTMHNRPDITAALADAAGSIYPFLDTARIAKVFESRKRDMKEIVEAFIANEKWVTERGWTDQQKAADLARKRRLHVRETASEAIDRMNARFDPDLGGSSLSKTHVDSLVTLFQKNAKAMPGWRVQNALLGALALSYRKMSAPGDEKALDERLGDFFDYQHLSVAGAYADVFTCDGKVAAAITKARVGVGRSPPLKRKGHPEGTPGFVAHLMATWP